MTHRQKQRLARRKRTREEIANNVSIFQTIFWLNRAMEIRERVLKTEENRKHGKSIRIVK
jgi:hypothetical protein